MPEKSIEPKFYAVINKDNDIRRRSSSGGVFTPIAESIIDAGGIVVGPAFGEDMRLMHIAVDKKEDLTRLRGSKYVQSSMRGAYEIIKNSPGRPVLFCGTPCQTGAIRSYFGSMENLYLLDLVCHGAPMKMAFKKYIEYLEQKYKAKVKNIDFRKKINSWRHYDVEITFEGGKKVTEPAQINPYMKGFLDGMYITSACHACKFKGINRSSDITLGDFWGIEQFDKSMDDDMGTSMVLINSEAGAKLFDNIKDKLIIKETTEQTAIEYNPAIIRSAKPHTQRQEIINALDEKGFGYIAEHYIKAEEQWHYRLRQIKSKLLGR